jgi:hypothetical protein
MFDKTSTGAKRSVSINFFDREQIGGFEKHLPVLYVVNKRLEQAKYLAELYGSGNRGAMGATPLKLDSIDAWRVFLRAKVQDLRKAGNNSGDALTTVVDLLERYLQSFTMSTPYNIEDVVAKDEDNYLKRSYPRALTGQLIQDCGVYALRLTYLLSLVREDLGLRFRLIVLPSHVGVIVTGEGVPTFIAHSNQLNRIDSDKLEELKKSWTAGNPGVTTEGKEFDGALGAAYFSQGVDQPFRLIDVPLSIKNDDPLQKEMLQRFYGSEVLKPVVGEDPKAGITSFELEYLAILAATRRHHNELVVPTWNGPARMLWDTHGKLLSEALQGDRKGFTGVAEAYKTKLDDVFSKVDIGRKALDDRRAAVSKALGEHPALIAKGATRGRGSLLPLNPDPEIKLAQHRRTIAEAIAAGGLTTDPKSIVPPFASDAAKPHALELSF